MQKAITLIEVLISLVLITVIMASNLSVQNNSLLFYEKIKNLSNENSLISIGIYEKDKNLDLSTILKFKDDDIDKEFKEHKLKIDENMVKNDTVESENHSFKIVTYEKKITLDEKMTKNFYRIDIELQ